jgi:hypothetical protein
MEEAKGGIVGSMRKKDGRRKETVSEKKELKACPKLEHLVH